MHFVLLGGEVPTAAWGYRWIDARAARSMLVHVHNCNLFILSIKAVKLETECNGLRIVIRAS